MPLSTVEGMQLVPEDPPVVAALPLSHASLGTRRSCGRRDRWSVSPARVLDLFEAEQLTVLRSPRHVRTALVAADAGESRSTSCDRDLWGAPLWRWHGKKWPAPLREGY